jgi:Clostripain family
MKTTVPSRLLAFLLCLSNFHNATEQAEKKSLCFMLYQMADNNLESAIRADLIELTQSKLVKDPSVTTWVYYDALNLGTPDQTFIEETPIPDLYQPDGTPVGNEGAKFEGSRYFTYDTANQRVIVNTTLEGEQNSDSPNVVYDFAVHALKDCVAKGSQEFFFAMSSHGGGYMGFGGDENQRRRRLTMDNYQIVETLEQALADVEGAPNKFDMIGFDACLMQAAGALDDFSPITKYYLASEATEPGHGKYPI